MSVIPVIQEAEIRKLMDYGQSRQKVREIPISTNKPNSVAQVCDPS
jgi:hypothetical protein